MINSFVVIGVESGLFLDRFVISELCLTVAIHGF